MKKNNYLVDITIIIIAIAINIYILLHPSGTTLFKLLSIWVIVIIWLYIRNAKNSIYGGKFNEHFKDNDTI